MLLPFGCKKDHDEPPIVTPIDDHSLPSAAILRVNVIEKTADHLKFRMDIAVFRDSKNVEDQLKADNFVIDSVDFYGYTANFKNNLTKLVNGGNPVDYSALMLMDQSGSIYDSDPNDYRLEAANIFCSNLGMNNNVALWSFSGYNYQQLVGFTTDTAKVMEKIEQLRNQEGGSTPLYSTQFDGVDFVKTNGAKTNKAVLTFTDGENTEWGKTNEEVVEQAKVKGVLLYNIGLGEVSSTLLLDQAVATGGAFMYAKDARQLISIFGNLGKLLTNTAIYYQTEWTISGKDNGTLFQGNGEVKHELKITFPFGGEITVPFNFKYQ
ncbi:hypothetical protein GCM10023231_40730 [Olivibacter ginsenosidimutans]|uniref:VWFA domain-containing protein n=1 Tax=Olivibacter ginsenosidimutans TaxID=1176537 RepID=A0ABP9CF87_9SPHI